MAGDKKTKSDPVPKKPDPAPKSETTATDKSAAGVDSPKAKAGEKAADKAPDGAKAADPATSYSRGEGQKPVSRAYRDNWNVIFGKKNKKR